MQAESNPQNGSDPVLGLLKEYKIPVNLENYLGLAFPGKSVDQLGAEEILQIPEKIRPKT